MNLIFVDLAKEKYVNLEKCVICLSQSDEKVRATRNAVETLVSAFEESRAGGQASAESPSARSWHANAMALCEPSRPRLAPKRPREGVEGGVSAACRLPNSARCPGSPLLAGRSKGSLRLRRPEGRLAPAQWPMRQPLEAATWLEAGIGDELRAGAHGSRR